MICGQMKHHKASISWFTVVGVVAALVHYVVAVSSEVMYWLSAPHANILGFLFAFPVSYLGHRQLSFSHHTSTHQYALPRFFAIALLGFLANQALVLTILRFTSLPFWLTLGIVMLIIAVSTYLLSHFWAFKGEA